MARAADHHAEVGTVIRSDLTASMLVAAMLLAATTSYDRVFASTAWRPDVAAAAGAATVIVLIVRRLGGGVVISTAATAVAYFALVPWFVGVTKAPSMPTLAVLAELDAVMRQGWIEIATEVAPAPVTAGLTAIAVSGWWFVAHVANWLVVAAHRGGWGLAAVGVLWAVPLVFPHDETGITIGSTTSGTVIFLAAGGLVLLYTTPRQRAGGALSGTGIGAAVIALSLTAPWLLPDHGERAWIDVGSGATTRGYQPIVDVTTRLNEPVPRDVLEVRTNQPSYLRLAGLDHFDGGVWRLGDTPSGTYRPSPSSLTSAASLLPPEQPAAITEIVEVDVTVLELENVYVPTPYQPVEVLGPFSGDLVWSTEGGFLTSFDSAIGAEQDVATILPGVEYRVRAARPAPTLNELETVVFDEAAIAGDTRLPREYPELTELAQRVYDEAGASSVVAKALALQEWFVEDERFTYDLDVPALRGDDALTNFVLEDRVGYCEYFASAMAVMLRATGIPARVAVGFLPGRQTTPATDGELAEYVVATTDAHAWVEVLFPGYGWVAFEPTPRSDEAQMLPRVDDLAPSRTERERRLDEALEVTQDSNGESPEPLEPEINTPVDESASNSQSDAHDPTTDGGRRGGSPTGWFAGVLALTGLVAGALVRLLLVRRRDRGVVDPRRRVLAAQRQLLAAGRALGATRQRQETTAEVLSRWDRLGRTTTASALSNRLQAAAFGGAVDSEEVRGVEDRVGVVIDELKRSASTRERAIAPLRRLVELAGTLRR